MNWHAVYVALFITCVGAAVAEMSILSATEQYWRRHLAGLVAFAIAACLLAGLVSS